MIRCSGQTRSQVPQKGIAHKIDAIIQYELVTFQEDPRPRKIVNNLAELLESLKRVLVFKPSTLPKTDWKAEADKLTAKSKKCKKTIA